MTAGIQIAEVHHPEVFRIRLIQFVVLERILLTLFKHDIILRLSVHGCRLDATIALLTSSQTLKTILNTCTVTVPS